MHPPVSHSYSSPITQHQSLCSFSKAQQASVLPLAARRPSATVTLFAQLYCSHLHWPPSPLMMSPTHNILAMLLLLLASHLSSAARPQPTELVDQQPLPITYHKGQLLTGPITVNLIWYGKFTPSQRAIVADFITSLSPSSSSSSSSSTPLPSVSTWWATVDKYHRNARTTPSPHLTLSPHHLLDSSYSLGTHLTSAHLALLASRGGRRRAINVVLTAADVTVDGFCSTRCGTHGASPRSKAGRYAYIWVGNSATQCPGHCAWPFHQPIYGPQTPPLVAPNADVGVDGMVINLATLLAGTVTNPFGNGYFQGSQEAPLEAASACTGVYAKGAYPGYAGDLLLDPTTGASYNANGVNGRKYLLPAMLDPSTSACSTLV